MSEFRFKLKYFYFVVFFMFLSCKEDKPGSARDLEEVDKTSNSLELFQGKNVNEEQGSKKKKDEDDKGDDDEGNDGDEGDDDDDEGDDDDESKASDGEFQVSMEPFASGDTFSLVGSTGYESEIIGDSDSCDGDDVYLSQIFLIDNEDSHIFLYQNGAVTEGGTSSFEDGYVIGIDIFYSDPGGSSVDDCETSGDENAPSAACYVRMEDIDILDCEEYSKSGDTTYISYQYPIGETGCELKITLTLEDFDNDNLTSCEESDSDDDDDDDTSVDSSQDSNDTDLSGVEDSGDDFPLDPDAGACDYLVDPNGDYQSIQDALDAAGDLELICVTEGTYTENLVFPINHDTKLYCLDQTPDTDGNFACILEGASDCDTTTDSSDYSCSTIKLGESDLTDDSAISEETIISGFNITGGLGSSCELSACGSPDWSDSTGYGGFGGGIFVFYSSPTLKNLKVYGNEARSEEGTPDDNTNSSGGRGGGLALINSNTKISHLLIRGNEAYDGGGIFHNDGGDGNDDSSYEVFVEDTAIYGNKAAYGGGVYRAGYADASYNRVTISGNYASISSYSVGGGIRIGGQVSTSAITLSNSIVRNNESAQTNKNSYDISLQTSRILGIINSVIDCDRSCHYNTNVNGCSDYLCSETDDVVTGNADYITISDSLDSAIYFEEPIEDPSESNPIDDTESYDYNMSSSSSDAVDVGEACDEDPNVLDLAGNQRCVGGFYDAGAYEYQGSD